MISSVYTAAFDFEKKIKAGASMFHITGGKKTQTIIHYLDTHFPGFPYICTEGKTFNHLRSRKKAELLQ